VIFLIDDGKNTGFNDFNSSNMIFIDHGDGVFSSYLHHHTKSARVKLGDVVSVGTILASSGKIGTAVPHLHFDLRGRDWETTHDVRFICADQKISKVIHDGHYQSMTPEPEAVEAGSFQDSPLIGTEFLANGVRLDSRATAYLLPYGTEIVFNGSVLDDVRRVHFHLFKPGEYTKDFPTAAVDPQGRFSLSIKLPESSCGSWWYRVTAESKSGDVAVTRTLPAYVCSPHS
jgi:murein DD-endopeptidase MepM/ murein hydrolase activator NlpD